MDRAPIHLVLRTVAGLALVGCSASGRVAFHPTDPAFVPRPGVSAPEVYLHRNEVPNVALRSVGVIEVTGSNAPAKAAAKGKELGCSMLVEHSVFLDITDASKHVTRDRRDSIEDRALLGHGGFSPDTHSTRVPTKQFDCVMKIENQTPAAPLVM